MDLNNIGKVLKFPSKQRRKYYRNKFFSLNSAVEIGRIIIGVLLAEVTAHYIFKLW